jgi:hypothetical protein
MFYLATLICVAWWVLVLLASRLLVKHNRTHIAEMITGVGFIAGLLGSMIVGDILLNTGTLFIGVFAFVCLLSGFIFILKQRHDSKKSDMTMNNYRAPIRAPINGSKANISPNWFLLGTIFLLCTGFLAFVLFTARAEDLHILDTGIHANATIFMIIPPSRNSEKQVQYTFMTFNGLQITKIYADVWPNAKIGDNIDVVYIPDKPEENRPVAAVRSSPALEILTSS